MEPCIKQRDGTLWDNTSVGIRIYVGLKGFQSEALVSNINTRGSASEEAADRCLTDSLPVSDKATGWCEASHFMQILSNLSQIDEARILLLGIILVYASTQRLKLHQARLDVPDALSLQSRDISIPIGLAYLIDPPKHCGVLLASQQIPRTNANPDLAYPIRNVRSRLHN